MLLEVVEEVEEVVVKETEEETSTTIATSIHDVVNSEPSSLLPPVSSSPATPPRTRKTVTNRIQPRVLEVQWGPDCSQAMIKNPFFREDILTAIYLNHDDNKNCDDDSSINNNKIIPL